jgi:two-component system CheB/CheR fusion protein
MYFTAETQARILARFHFALADSGVLLLGKAERLLSHGALFQPLDLKHRTFRKTARPPHRNGLLEEPTTAQRVAMSGIEALRSEARSPPRCHTSW